MLRDFWYSRKHIFVLQTEDCVAMTQYYSDVKYVYPVNMVVNIHHQPSTAEDHDLVLNARLRVPIANIPMKPRTPTTSRDINTSEHSFCDIE